MLRPISWTPRTPELGSEPRRRTPSPSRRNSEAMRCHVVLRAVSPSEDRRLRERLRQTTMSTSTYAKLDEADEVRSKKTFNETPKSPLGTIAGPLGRWASQPQLWRLETKDFVRDSDMDSFGSVSDDEQNKTPLETFGPLVTMSQKNKAVSFRYIHFHLV